MASRAPLLIAMVQISSAVARTQINPDDLNGDTFYGEVNDAGWRCFSVTIGSKVSSGYYGQDYYAHSECGNPVTYKASWDGSFGHYSKTSSNTQYFDGGSGSCYNGQGRSSSLKVFTSDSISVPVLVEHQFRTCFYSVEVTIPVNYPSLQLHHMEKCVASCTGQRSTAALVLGLDATMPEFLAEKLPAARLSRRDTSIGTFAIAACAGATGGMIIAAVFVRRRSWVHEPTLLG